MLSEKTKKRILKNMEKPLPEDERKMFSFLRKFVLGTVRLFINIFYPMEFENLDNLPDSGAAIVAGNHGSNLDAPFLMFAINERKRWGYFVAKESLMRYPLFGKLLLNFGVIPVNTTEVEAYSVKAIFNVIKQNHVLAIFPQGTRCKTTEKEARVAPKTGAISFALRTNTPIVPIAIDSEYKVFKKSRIIFGEPYYVKSDKKRLSEAEMMAESIILMEKVYALMDREYPLKDKENLTDGILSNKN